MAVCVCVLMCKLSLPCTPAPGLHPVPGGVFPVPPAAVVLMKLLPPPTCFTVSTHPLSLSNHSLLSNNTHQLHSEGYNVAFDY